MMWNVRFLTGLSCSLLVLTALTQSILALVPVRPRPWLDESLAAKVIENGIGMKLVRIEPGTFVMGSPKEELGRNTNEQQHEVEITRPFFIGKYEVTQEEYQKVMGVNPSSFKDKPRHPVDHVSWNDAKEYCKKLTELELRTGKITAGMQYTLATEAEWEYCCRAGTRTPFSTGETISTQQANYNGQTAYGNGKVGESRGRPVDVGSFPPNAWGLHDMHGNVDEWCEDFHDGNYYPVSPRKDPTGPEKGGIRMLRGGCWTYRPHDCRSALRDGIDAAYRGNFIGFRVVLRLSPKSN